MSLKLYVSSIVNHQLEDGTTIQYRKIGFTTRSIDKRFSEFPIKLEAKYFVELPNYLLDKQRVDQVIDTYFNEYSVHFADAWSTELYDCGDDDETKQILKKLSRKWDGHFHTAHENNTYLY